MLFFYLINDMKNVEDIYDNGCLFVLIFYFEKIIIFNILRNMESKDFVDGDIGFWIGVWFDDLWYSICLLFLFFVVLKLL